MTSRSPRSSPPASDARWKSHKIEWDGLIPALLAGKIDAIIAGMSPREDRKASIDFSEPYYTSVSCHRREKGRRLASAASLQEFFRREDPSASSITVLDTVIDQIPDVAAPDAHGYIPRHDRGADFGKVDGYVSERPRRHIRCCCQPGSDVRPHLNREKALKLPRAISRSRSVCQGARSFKD
jgi:hypothetical protein